MLKISLKRRENEQIRICKKVIERNGHNKSKGREEFRYDTIMHSSISKRK